jgi:KipI family sensor histidine kinase inhibitor
MPARRSRPTRQKGAPRTRLAIHPLGDTALVAELGSRLDTALNTRAIALAAALKKRRDVRQALAGYASVTVQFDPDVITHEALGAAIRRLAAKRPPVEVPGRLHRIPVTYDGPDLDEVATRLSLSVAQVIDLHTRPIYRVFLLGFVPGWAYLGPLPEELALPRRSEPRTKVPAGSVAIAGRQTGIYPLDVPGGWHLLGRTGVRLFLPDSEPPCLFRAGDRVKFFAAR